MKVNFDSNALFYYQFQSELERVSALILWWNFSQKIKLEINIVENEWEMVKKKWEISSLYYLKISLSIEFYDLFRQINSASKLGNEYLKTWDVEPVFIWNNFVFINWIILDIIFSVAKFSVFCIIGANYAICIFTPVFYFISNWLCSAFAVVECASASLCGFGLRHSARYVSVDWLFYEPKTSQSDANLRSVLPSVMKHRFVCTSKTPRRINTICKSKTSFRPKWFWATSAKPNL